MSNLFLEKSKFSLLVTTKNHQRLVADPPSTPRSRGDCLLVHHSHDCEGKRPSVGPYAMGVVMLPRRAPPQRTAQLHSHPCRLPVIPCHVDPSSSTPHGAAGGAGMPSPVRFLGIRTFGV